MTTLGLITAQLGAGYGGSATLAHPEPINKPTVFGAYISAYLIALKDINSEPI
ncbi:MAG: hypothetical protein QXQ57_00780 [Sulfolobales archaeon]